MKKSILLPGVVMKRVKFAWMWLNFWEVMVHQDREISPIFGAEALQVKPGLEFRLICIRRRDYFYEFAELKCFFSSQSWPEHEK